jgi:hypothetical protein
MSKFRYLLCLGTALLGLIGCNPEEMIKKAASEEDQQVATQCIDALREKRFDAIESTLAEGLKGPETRATLEGMANMLPAGNPDAVKLVGVNIKVEPSGARTSDITYQYTFGKQHFMVNCATTTEESTRHIVALNVRQLEFSIDEQAGFSLKGKSPAQLALLCGGVLVLLITLAALVLCILDKTLQRKWLWIIFILVGFGQLSVNWNSGTWDSSLAHVMLFSASAVSRGYGGWVISVALPVGAAVYLVRRFLNHRAAARSKPADTVQ